MADLLDPNVARVHLNPQQLSLLLAQQATTQAVQDRKSEAFKNVVAELQTSKESVERFKHRAKYLELDVARTDAYLAKVHQQLTNEQKKTAELSAKLANAQSQEKVCDRCHGIEDEKGGAKNVQGEDRTSSFTKDKKAQKKDEHEPSTKAHHSMSGVSFEDHELLIQQMMRIKQELTTLAREKGQDVDKILDAAEYRETIRKLQEDIQDKADENERLLEKIDSLCSKEDGPASQIVYLQFLNEKLEKRLRLSQVMIDTLSKRCEELKDDLRKHGPQRKEDGRGADNSRVFLPIPKEEGKKKTPSEKTGSTSKGTDETDGVPASQARDQFAQQKQQLTDKIQHLEAELKQVTGSNKQLMKSQQEAEKQREIFEQRYNTLMATVQESQKKQQQCSNCRSLELEIAKLKQELASLKEVHMVVETQMKLYEEDLRLEQRDAEAQKQKNNFHMEQWKKNCQLLGHQVDLLTNDLRKERDEIKKLKQQLSMLRPQGGRPAMSLAPNFTQQRCAPRGPKSSPWQEGFHDIECDGPGEDVTDGGDVADSMPGDTLGGSIYHSMRSSFTLSRKPLECPRCKREYPSDRLEEFQRHVDKCIDST